MEKFGVGVCVCVGRGLYNSFIYKHIYEGFL